MTQSVPVSPSLMSESLASEVREVQQQMTFVGHDTEQAKDLAELADSRVDESTLR